MFAIALMLNAALAHEPGLSYARIDGEQLVETFAAAEVASGDPPMGQVSAGGQPCALGRPELRAVEGDGVQVAASLDCPAGGDWRYEATFLGAMRPGHRHFVEAFGQPVAVLSAARPAVDFDGERSAASVAKSFVLLGIEHIWTGYDHLAFLLALLLVARSMREMLGIVTGFTLAHSLTLSLAALGLITPSAAVVEPAIALSIAYAGLENLWKPSARRRFVVTATLGLIHGFGFAGLLAELGLPEDNLLTALIAFNGGVELGQAAVVALTLPALLWLSRRPRWSTRAVPALSIAVAAAGLFWFVERVFPA